VISRGEILTDRYEAYRQRWPGGWSNDGTEYWVFDTETCTALLSDRRLTSHRARLSELALEANEADLARLFSNWLMYTDGKEHAKSRRLAINHLKWNTPYPETGFSEFVGTLTTKLKPLASIDVVSDLASPWAAHYVLGCCGIPRDAVPAIERLAHEIARVPGLSSPDVEDVSQAALSYRGLRTLLRDLRPPEGSVAEAILRAESFADGEPLAAALVNVLIDGVHPTAAGLSSAVILLSDHKLESVTSEDIAQVLRLEAPFQYIARFTLQPLEIHRENIPAGTRVVLCIGASARCSQRLDQNVDLTFGFGRHRCIGESIARHCILEAFQSVVKEWAPSGYLIDGEVSWIASVGYRALLEARIRRNSA
jgi:cytochrome P450